MEQADPVPVCFILEEEESSNNNNKKNFPCQNAFICVSTVTCETCCYRATNEAFQKLKFRGCDVTARGLSVYRRLHFKPCRDRQSSSLLCERHRKNLHLQSRDLSRRVSSAGTHLSAGTKTASSSVLFLRLLVSRSRVFSKTSGRHTTRRTLQVRSELNGQVGTGGGGGAAM